MAPSTHGANLAAGKGSSGDMPPRKAPTVARSGGVPPLHRGKGAARSGSTGEILQKKAATASSGEVLPVPVDPGSMPMKTTTASSGGSQPHGRKDKTGLRTEKMPWNSSTKVKPDTIGSGGQTSSAKDSEESAAKHRTIKGKSHTVLSEETQREIAAKMALHAKQQEEGRLFIQELNELRHGEDVSFEELLSYNEKMGRSPPRINLNVKLEDQELLRRQHCLRGLYRFRYYKYKLSQQVSKKELRADKLKEDNPEEEEKEDGTTLKEDNPDEEEKEDGTTLKEDNPDEEEEEEEDGATPKEEFLQDITEDDCTPEFIQKQGYFKRFERDGTLDWFFHPDYIYCASLNDYQRLVLRNYGGYEYARWTDYHRYLQTYKMEREYLKYCEKLSKDLNWIKNYLHIEYTSHKWRIIESRGSFQAHKIAATDFTEISTTFAHIGYSVRSLTYILFNVAYNVYHVVSNSLRLSIQEFLDSICILFSELDGLYFELWQRVCQSMVSTQNCVPVFRTTNQLFDGCPLLYANTRMLTPLHYFPLNNVQISFKDAMKEVYNLNKFPLHQPLIKRALEFDKTLKFLEQKFNEFMDNITSKDKKDKAPQKWIAEAVKKQYDMPKTYEQYIRKKIGIACIIGISGIEAIE